GVDNLGRLELQVEIDDPNRTNVKWHESRIRGRGATIINESVIYYTHNSYPQNNLDILTINYYDDYDDFDGLLDSEIKLTSNASIYGKTITSKTKSLPTYGFVRILGTNQWITSVTYYDEDAKPIYSGSKNAYLQTVDIVKSDFDFAGKVTQTESSHVKGTNPSIIINDIYTYDHAGRLLTQKQQINNHPIELITKNTYDELGQLVSK